MKLYVYGLVETGAIQAAAGLAGIDGQPVRIEPAGALHAIVSDFSVAAINANRESILLHEKVLDAFLEQVTPLPFRFGTVVAPATLAEFVETNREALASDMNRVRGCVQMSVKILAKAEPSSLVAPLSPLEVGEGPGVRFLKAKQAGRELLLGAANELTAAMGDLPRAHQTTVLTTPRFMARVAHLVERTRLEEYVPKFRAAVGLRPEIAYMQSGPWPPYSFVAAALALERSVKA
jgi:hypothetical protein